MRPDRIFVSGSSSIPHPVTDRLLGGTVAARPAGEAGDAGAYRLIVVDARLANGDLAADGIAQRALAARVPVLILAPAEGQLAPLAPVVGAVSRSPQQAVLITPAKNAERRFEVKALGYPGISGREPGKKRHADQPRRPKRRHHDTEGTSRALPRFISHIEHRVERGYQFSARKQFPDGAKSFYTTWNEEMDFEFHTEGEENFRNSGGLFTFDYEIWALLSQSATSEETYIVTEGSYMVDPGTLDENNEDARAVMLFKAKSGTRPTAAEMKVSDHIPNTATDSWSESFDLEIYYQDPFGGYPSYDFEVSVNQSITQWSVVNSSEGTMLGSTWYVNSPVDGYTFPENSNDAFNGSGHVEPFPATCMETLTLHDASAWRTPGRYSGSLLFETNAKATGWSCYGTNCGLAFCYDPETDNNVWTFYPWFEVFVNMT